jgi:hypothetical protein|tara:strand:+ start:12664 stop:13194 length:531 start_codon:yes stop_codon:yes gene_type:complete
MQQVETYIGKEVLESIPLMRGMMWEKIEEFGELMKIHLDDCVSHLPGEKQSEELKEIFPLKQHLESGIYTRELFMPKGSLVVSMIHKQNHPSFLLKGKVSYLTDEGIVETISAPHTIFTKEGAQRVLYIHEDTDWACVYKTNAITFEEAEADVYTFDYKSLPKALINKKKLLWKNC